MAHAGTITPTSVTPPAPTGANGWYNKAQLGTGGTVVVTYVCTPDLGEIVVSCPGTAAFGHPTVTAALTAVFNNGLIDIPVSLAVPVKVDTKAPVPASITRPVAGKTYDTNVTAAYSCSFNPETSGPGSCVGTVATGAALPVGSNLPFTVTATDAAGNPTATTLTYSVADIPGVATLGTPAAAASVSRRPTFTWTPSADVGAGIANYTLTIKPTAGASKTYTVPPGGAGVVSFAVPDDLAAGAYTWTVTTNDTANHTAVSGARAVTVVANPPAAPRVTAAPIATNDTRPTFGWEAAETGGTFNWEIVGTSLSGSTAAATVQTPQALALGDYGFRVRQTTTGGLAGAWSATASFSVIPAPPVGTAGGPTVGSPAGPTVPNIGTPPKTRSGLPTRNAILLKPGAGALISRTPVLTWKRTRGASAYNLQLFRVLGKKYVKVISTFPRSNRYKMPKRLAAGSTFVWRVWPYFASTRKYSKKPLGVSWFDTTRTSQR
jgi:hypothetical protein